MIFHPLADRPHARQALAGTGPPHRWEFMANAPLPDSDFVHLSDLHILGEAEAKFLGQDPSAKLRCVLSALKAMNIRPRFFVISGDLTNRGTLPAYERFNDALDEIKRFGVPVLMALGNHDTRRYFRQLILNESSTDEAEPYVYSRQIDGLRVIVLDSRVPGAVHGYIDDHQLAWLDRALSSQPSLPTLLVCHHPPLPMYLPIFKNHCLGGQARLAEVVSGHKILGILSGHLHFSLLGRFGSIPCVATGSVAATFDPSAATLPWLWNGSSFSLCRIQGGQLIVRRFVLPGKQLNCNSRSTQAAVFSRSLACPTDPT
jgi:3',5'-cyclic-AMP phosphodiesterase